LKLYKDIEDEGLVDQIDYKEQGVLHFEEESMLVDDFYINEANQKDELLDNENPAEEFDINNYESPNMASPV
jgi:hypothetical protein